MLANMESTADDIQTLTQAIQSPDSVKWADTCAAEVASLLDHDEHGVLRSSLRAVPHRPGHAIHGKGRVLR